MKEKNLIQERKINLFIFNIRLVCFFLCMSFISCQDEIKQERLNYFYKIIYNDSDSLNYSYRMYSHVGDTIKEKVILFDNTGKIIPYNGEGGNYLKVNDDLFLLRGKLANPYIGDLLYTFKAIDTCWVYDHPYHLTVENCYKGLSKDGQYIISSNQKASHGFDFTINLDKDYTLIRKINHSPFYNFKEEHRVDKNVVPDVILKKADSLSN